MSKKAVKYRVFKSGGVWHATTSNQEGSKAEAYTKTGATPVEALSALIGRVEREEINGIFTMEGSSL